MAVVHFCPLALASAALLTRLAVLKLAAVIDCDRAKHLPEALCPKTPLDLVRRLCGARGGVVGDEESRDIAADLVTRSFGAKVPLTAQFRKGLR